MVCNVVVACCTDARVSHKCRMRHVYEVSRSHMSAEYPACHNDTLHLCETSLISYMWHLHHTCGTRHISYVWHGAFIFVSHIQGGHSLVVVPSFACTGWRRLIGSPKLQIIFHKRATKCRSLLRKMTYIDKGSYESSQPCKCSMPSSCWIFLWHAALMWDTGMSDILNHVGYSYGYEQCPTSMYSWIWMLLDMDILVDKNNIQHVEYWLWGGYD